MPIQTIMYHEGREDTYFVHYRYAQCLDKQNIGERETPEG